MQSYDCMSRSAFSLVELAIVLVILGLLTGGILSGQALIRAAELRAVGTEYQRYLTATHSFRDKYLALPGDMLNATAFWGKDAAACPAHSGTAALPGTCNGDGSGFVGGAGVPSQTNERMQFWKQLALAGLIEGTYTGLTGPNGPQHGLPGENIPRSKMNNGSWFAHNITSTNGSADMYAISYGNNFYFSARGGATDTIDPILAPEEAWNIDMKFDDGRPAYGKVVARYWNNLCAAANNGAHSEANLDASYKLSDPAVRCALYFPQSF